MMQILEMTNNELTEKTLTFFNMMYETHGNFGDYEPRINNGGAYDLSFYGSVGGAVLMFHLYPTSTMIVCRKIFHNRGKTVEQRNMFSTVLGVENVDLCFVAAPNGGDSPHHIYHNEDENFQKSLVHENVLDYSNKAVLERLFKNVHAYITNGWAKNGITITN